MPLITISRLYGSGGSEVAERVAGALGWQLVDSAFVEEVAQRLRLTPAQVEAYEERVRTLAQRVGDALSLSVPELAPPASAMPRPATEEQVAEMERRLIREAGARGNSVLVGRGAQSVLAARSDVLHVFCYAPRAALVARTVARLGVSEREAERAVDETNHQREQFVRRHWQRSWRAPENYHLCLNTDWLGLDGAADAVVRLARSRFELGERAGAE